MKKVFLKSGLIVLVLIALCISCKKGKNNDTTPNNQNTLPTQGLIAYYPFSGNANDESGNGYNGTVNGAVLTMDRFNHNGSAYAFNGGSDQIITTCPGVLGGKPRTISMWIKKNDFSNGWIIELGYGQGTPAGNWYCKTYFLNNATQVTLDINTAAIGYTPVIDNNSWHHYVWVVPDMLAVKLSDVKTYQDGILLTNILATNGDINTPINTITGEGVALGRGSDCTGNGDDVRIYNRELSDNEIQQLYHEGGW